MSKHDPNCPNYCVRCSDYGIMAEDGLCEDCRELIGLKEKVKKLKAKLDRALGMLRGYQYEDQAHPDDEPVYFCMYCGAKEGTPCKDYCELAAILKEQEASDVKI